ncbi:MAG: FHA domain-containing protein [Myxococcales bacterium]|nr:FHA domain-containing protein [Myxococcales bacterium]
MFQLQIQNDGESVVVPVIRDSLTIGRKEGNAIRLTEKNVSRRHAKLIKYNGKVYVEDIGSSYGTRVNGERIKGRTELQSGDVVSIGDYRLILMAG